MRHEKSTRDFVDFGIDFLKTGKDSFQRHFLCKCEIKFLGKTVFSEIASFQRCAALEYKTFADRWAGKAYKKPGKTVITFEDRFGYTAAAFAGEPVGKKRNVSLWNYESGSHYCLNLFLAHIKPQPPTGHEFALLRQHWIEDGIRRGELLPQRFYFSKGIQIKQYLSGRTLVYKLLLSF